MIGRPDDDKEHSCHRAPSATIGPVYSVLGKRSGAAKLWLTTVCLTRNVKRRRVFIPVRSTSRYLPTAIAMITALRSLGMAREAFTIPYSFRCD